jgi:TonB family protein
MGPSLLPPFLAILFLAVSAISSEDSLETLRPVDEDVSPLPSTTAKNSSVAQDTSVQQNSCNWDQKTPLPKLIKTVQGTYSEEAMRKDIKGTVVMCVAVDKSGRVSEAKILRGPEELFQSSINAAKQWEFEPPIKAPVLVEIEMTYSFTRPCPSGKKFDKTEVTYWISPKSGQSDAVKIVEGIYQPVPRYPSGTWEGGLQGPLDLSIVVNTKGIVTDARVIKSLDPDLDQAALNTVRSWRFKVSHDGKPGNFQVNFNYQVVCLDQP